MQSLLHAILFHTAHVIIHRAIFKQAIPSQPVTKTRARVQPTLSHNIYIYIVYVVPYVRFCFLLTRKCLRRIHRTQTAQAPHHTQAHMCSIASKPRFVQRGGGGGGLLHTHEHALPKPKYIYKPIIDQHNSSEARERTLSRCRFLPRRSMRRGKVVAVVVVVVVLRNAAHLCAIHCFRFRCVCVCVSGSNLKLIELTTHSNYMACNPKSTSERARKICACAELPLLPHKKQSERKKRTHTHVKHTRRACRIP